MNASREQKMPGTKRSPSTPKQIQTCSGRIRPVASIGRAPRQPALRINTSSRRRIATRRSRTISCLHAWTEYQERLPGIVLGGDGSKLHKLQRTEGFRPIRSTDLNFEGEDFLRAESSKTPAERLEALGSDGADCELIARDERLTMWAAPDASFRQTMCKARSSRLLAHGR